MQTFFEIGSYTDLKNEETVLLWEIGSNYSLISLWTEDVTACHYIQGSMFDELEMEKSIIDIFAPYKEADLKYKKTVICSAFPDALLVPRKFFAQDSNLLEQVYGVQSNGQFYDFAGQWQLVNFYSIPGSVLQFLKEQFPAASFRHIYTPFLKAPNDVDAPEQIGVHFLNKQFRVMVKKENNLLLMQVYTFSAPMDVVYYLLKICKEFELSQDQTYITLSGFIEADSALYKEIYQYFTNVAFAKHSGVDMPGHDYPHHYFTSLHNLAACVS
ncbi:DUF3822 family protein [Chitinophagaceae bacterium LB-8]|uniref:DUF3822 family protein n=1 Tax=Paraflavisolibacter caeni TaxID=2982496 RepID=A0A9X3BJN9_9BACT|nr:DUF3822 family protein [Paraflavisolibacter caeni]MCU7551468.1 DUF3822 family protein [Paraflavisolibacter caeni]